MTQEQESSPDIHHVKATRSYLFFKEFIAELSEDPDESRVQSAKKVSKMIENGEIGVICADNIGSDGLGVKVAVTQLSLGEKNIPTFIVPYSLNTHELIGDFVGILPLMDPDNVREKAKKSVVCAVDEMVFALDASERFGGANGS